eukprot:208524_1
MLSSLLLLLLLYVVCNAKIRIFSTMFICLPSEEITQKYLSIKIANISDYEVYILRPNCCSSMIPYDDNTPSNIHLIEFNSTHSYFELREMLTAYDIASYISVHQSNCRRVLTNNEIMTQLKHISFDFSIIQTWDLCGDIISDILHLQRIDFQIESFMYPMLNSLYHFIYYDRDGIIPQSGSDETFQVHLLVPYFDAIRTEFNVHIPSQRDSWDQMTTFLWIPSVPGFEYPNYLLPRVQFIGAIRSERNDAKCHDIVHWLDALPDDAVAILFSFGTLWHNMNQLRHRDEHIFDALHELLSNEERYGKYYIIFKGIHREEEERKLLELYGEMKRFKYYNYTQWIPQTLVLNHKRVRLLVCHGGYGHVQEAIYYGVPFITIPFQFDQPLNSEKSLRIGVSLSLNVTAFTSVELIQSMGYILNNETFGRSASAWSRIVQAYDGMSIIKFTMQVLAEGMMNAFKLDPDNNKTLKYL